MKRLVIPIGLMFLLASCDPNRSILVDKSGIQIYFSPRGGCTEAIVNQLDKAQREILVQAYSFTSAPIAQALVNAQRRGLNVQIILDRGQKTEKYSEADFTLHAGIPTYIDYSHAIAHNKVIVIDGKVVLTGSFNFTKGAEEKNAENLLVIQSPDVSQKYIENWKEHLRHSEAYEGKEDKMSQKDSGR
jgi:phosphatidylserine/phosphatidylglycerophosphate/cardiolipin synthase-like enzyme